MKTRIKESLRRRRGVLLAVCLAVAMAWVALEIRHMASAACESVAGMLAGEQNLPQLFADVPWNMSRNIL